MYTHYVDYVYKLATYDILTAKWFENIKFKRTDNLLKMDAVNLSGLAAID
jgi:hypothetical protein